MGRFSRQTLTYVHRWGCNALGVIEFAVCLVPLVLGTIGADAGETPRGVETFARVLAVLLASATAVFDLRWRWREEPDPRWWVKAFSYEAGGSLVFLPGWLLWATWAGLVLLLLITVPLGPSPYAR